MSSITKVTQLQNKVQELEKEVAHFKHMCQLKEKVILSTSEILKFNRQSLDQSNGQIAAYHKIFSITPEEVTAIKTVLSVAQRLQEVSFIKPLNS